MIPLRDENPSGTFPAVTLGIVLANAGAFAYELSLGRGASSFISQWGLVPARVLALGKEHQVSPSEALLPFLTSIFLHGGWLHILSNMWFLWIFGDNVEDRLGHFCFAAFYVICGLAAGATHVVMNSRSGLPTIGASGAVAGVLGAYFLTFPRAKVVALLPVLFFWQLVSFPAWFFLLYWFLIQFFVGALSVAGPEIGNVAWWAHIGGFAAGAALIIVFPRCRGSRQRKYRTWYDATGRYRA